MIQPEDIRRKADSLYSRFLRAYVAGEAFFPRTIPANTRPGDDMAGAIRAVGNLRDGAKETIGYGYNIEWRHVNSRRHGRNRFPSRIVFETRDDYLRFIGRAEEFRTFADAVGEIRHRYPQLLEWVGSNTAKVAAVAADVPGLLNVLDVLTANPRPGCFVRELPISEDSKFVEAHQPLLRQWFDRILPPHTIRADEEHFERRYGLRYAQPHLLTRFLDKALQRQLGFPCQTLSIPLHTLGDLPMPPVHVFIVENKVNLLTMPAMPHALCLGGLGQGVTILRYLPWLADTTITYWGDLDVEGFAILSSLRALFPQVRSLLMDEPTLRAWRRTLAVDGNGQAPVAPPNLAAGEKGAFTLCRDHNLRIEQERLPQAAVCDALRSTE